MAILHDCVCADCGHEQKQTTLAIPCSVCTGNRVVYTSAIERLLGPDWRAIGWGNSDNIKLPTGVTITEVVS